MSPVLTRGVSALPPGTAYSRLMISLSNRRRNLSTVIGQPLPVDWPDTPQVAAAFDSTRQKSAVTAGTTTDSDWAAALADQGVAQEALNILRGLSIYDALTARMRRVPFLVSVPRQTGGGSGGSWVGESMAAPAVSYAFDTLRLSPKKPQLFYVATDELVRMGGPAGERTLRDASLGALAEYIDRQLLDPTVSGSSENPASITNGATSVTSTGTTAAQMTADFGGLINAITTSGKNLVWIMRPTTAARVALVLGGAASDVPRTLFGIPMALSGNSPQQVTLVDAGEIAYADDGQFAVALSQAASVEMDDAPTGSSSDSGSPAGPTPTTTVSMWQTNSTCFRLMRWLNWERVRSGSVSYMSVTY